MRTTVGVGTQKLVKEVVLQRLALGGAVGQHVLVRHVVESRHGVQRPRLIVLLLSQKRHRLGLRPLPNKKSCVIVRRRLLSFYHGSRFDEKHFRFANRVRTVPGVDQDLVVRVIVALDFFAHLAERFAVDVGRPGTRTKEQTPSKIHSNRSERIDALIPPTKRKSLTVVTERIPLVTKRKVSREMKNLQRHSL